MSEALTVNMRSLQRTGSAGSSPKASADKQRQELEDACEAFESIFMNYMLKEMRSTVPKSGVISGGNAESIYTSMMDSYLTKEIADTRSIGLSTLFQGQLERVDKPEIP